LARKLAKSFHFEVAPRATGFASAAKPEEFRFDGSGKTAASNFAPAGGEKRDASGPVFFQPKQESTALQVTAKPIQAQFDGPCLARGSQDLTLHFRRMGRRNHGADTPNPRSPQNHDPLISANRLKTKLVACPYQ
jgi:hypothetical protein